MRRLRVCRRPPRSTPACHGAALAVALVVAPACGGTRMPDPKLAVANYAAAAAKGDADAIYAMMTSAAQKGRSRAEVRQVVASEPTELLEQAKTLLGPDARMQASARLRFADGEEASLDLHDGHFEVSSAGTLPGGSRTPAEALDELRRVLARRSYAGLMRVLSSATRTAIEEDLRALVAGLQHPEGLNVQVNGDQAKIAVPGGHHVSLKRDSGIWRVEDFD